MQVRDLKNKRTSLETHASGADPMPGYMIEMLLASRNQTTMRTLIDRNMNIANAYYAQTLSLIMRVWKNDYAAHLSDMEAAMNMDQMMDNYVVIDALLAAGNNTAAQTAYVGMGQSVKMNDYELCDYEAYSAWVELGISENEWQNGATLNAAEVDALYSLVDNHWMNRAGKKAMAYLNRHRGEQFYIPPARGHDWYPRSSGSELWYQHELVNVYPNPANQMVSIELHLQQGLQPNGTLNIYDVTNRLVHTVEVHSAEQIITLDTREWASGLYFYDLRTGNQSHNGRFEIQH